MCVKGNRSEAAAVDGASSTFETDGGVRKVDNRADIKGTEV